MDRKFISLFAFFLFYLGQPADVCAAEGDFLFEGGTTGDSIVIADVKLEQFRKSEGNCLQIVDGGYKSTMSFSVSVPDGKTAQLSFSLLTDIDVEDDEVDLCNITFKAIVDDMPVKTMQGQDRIIHNSAIISLPAGFHRVSLEDYYTSPDGCVTTGNISNLNIHVHRFSTPQLKIEPVCGAKGSQRISCSICKRDSVFTFSSPFDNHVLSTWHAQNGSCLDNVGDVKVCQNCPYTEIAHVQLQQNHDFDSSTGTCKVCGLHMPACSSDSSVFYINNAGEMRILSELVSLGMIPGNIGVDIRADLVFDKIPMLPLGTFTNPFSGVLNGNGHRISGVTNAYQGFDGLGFVGVAKGSVSSHAVIANLIFDGGNNLRGAAFVGAIAGYASFCDIANCAAFGTLDGTDNVAGIVGYVDRQVSIVNCGAATTIRTAGKFNPMACNMTTGHILNTYGAATVLRDGTLDEISSADVRHCFSSHGSGSGITPITLDMLSSYQMQQWLKEESETPYFSVSEKDIYPVPVVNTDIVAKSNGPVRRWGNVLSRRAAASDEFDTEKGEELEVLRGYVDDNASVQLGQTPEEVMRTDSIHYPDHARLYIASRSVPSGFALYDKISGGNLLDFESVIIPADSSYIKNIEYEIVALGQVKAITATVDDLGGADERIDQYSISDGAYTLRSSITFDDLGNIICQENIDGRMRTVWSIVTTYDEADRPVFTNGFSHNYITGEVRLDYSYTYKNNGDNTDKGYEQYIDSETNTIHVFYNYIDSVSGRARARDHFIVRASDDLLMEIRTEKIIDGKPCLVDGIYFICGYQGYIEQMVSFGPVEADNPDSDIRLYTYDEYLGYSPGYKFPTAIRLPQVNQPSLKNQMDFNVYDVQGRVLRKVTDLRNPFCGLPHGLYIWHGSKYLVR